MWWGGCYLGVMGRVLPRCDGKVGGCYLGVVGRVLPRCDGEVGGCYLGVVGEVGSCSSKTTSCLKGSTAKWDP